MKRPPIWLLVGSLAAPAVAIAYRAVDTRPPNSDIARSALWYLAERPTLPRDDCSGLVEAVCERAGLDDVRGSVAQIWDEAEGDQRTSTDTTPHVGDLAFFDNTWDENGDGLVDDPLSHIAVVTAIEDDGTIEMVHHGDDHGIWTLRMNLEQPDEHSVDGHVLNDWLGKPGFGEDDHRLAGQLWHGFASVGRLDAEEAEPQKTADEAQPTGIQVLLASLGLWHRDDAPASASEPIPLAIDAEEPDPSAQDTGSEVEVVAPIAATPPAQRPAVKATVQPTASPKPAATLTPPPPQKPQPAPRAPPKPTPTPKPTPVATVQRAQPTPHTETYRAAATVQPSQLPTLLSEASLRARLLNGGALIHGDLRGLSCGALVDLGDAVHAHRKRHGTTDTDLANLDRLDHASTIACR